MTGVARSGAPHAGPRAPGCRACGAAEAPVSIGREEGGHALGRCPACGTVVALDLPAPGALAALYDTLFETGAYARHRRTYEALARGEPRWSRYRARLLRRLERRTRGRAMAEIGGGVGAFGMLATARGWSYADFDISEVAAGFARRLGLRATVFPEGEPPPVPAASADAVVMWEVVEHARDVAGLLRACRRALRPGGCLALSTPNWAYGRTLEALGPLASPPLHLAFFDAASLRLALEAAGFTEVRVFGKRLETPHPTAAGVAASARLLLGLREPETLCAFAGVGP